MADQHPIEGLMKTTMDNLKQMIDVNTIIGDPVETNDGTLIIPISKVTVGFATGGSEFKPDEEKKGELKGDYPFGGGSGAGVAVNPVAFLIVGKDNIKLMPIEYATPIEKIIDSVPEFLQNLMKSRKKDEDDCINVEVVNPS